MLDLVRGLAALAVVAGHTRSLLVVDWRNEGPLAALWYGATALGHQAVIVFIALSGFLVGGSLLRLGPFGWTWKGYVIKRAIRLGIVLIPALIFTLLVDMVGSSFSPGIAYYEGRSGSSVIAQPVMNRVSLPLFVGNALFLQQVWLPTFGSNGALWSLAYEFWFYILFPLLYRLLAPGLTLAQRGINVVAIGAVMSLLGQEGLQLFLVWLLGAAAAWVTQNVSLKSNATRRAVSVAVFLAALGFSLMKLPIPCIDQLIAVMFFPMLVLFSVDQFDLPMNVERVSDPLAKVSYSLYAMHLPLILVIISWSVPSGRMEFGVGAVLIHASICLGVLAVASVFWVLFERHTPRLQQLAAHMASSLAAARS